MKDLKYPARRGSSPGSGRGGARRGAGRPLGSTVASGAKVYAPTAEKAALLSLWKAEVGRQFPALVAAQLSAAQGVTHMQARDDAGRWQTVTDPAVMTERLNAGAEAYRLNAVAPSAPILKEVMDRMFGQSRGSLELDVSQSTTQLSDADLEAGLAELLEKLRGPNA
jgi:hypothetical protein|tara:strand:- start:161 stop:661 length:501 start_codon:yes stop_codon:yes gene_type:complete